MFRSNSRKQAATVTYPAVPDTDAAVAAKLRQMARETSNPSLAAGWNQKAAAAEAGQLHPEIRAEFAHGTTFGT